MGKTRRIPARADISSEQLILHPEEDGLRGIVAVSLGKYSTDWQAMPEHTHDMIELCLCTRGSLVFECNGDQYTVLPGNVFLTQPGDRHHLVTNHKGMRMYWLFFRYPAKRGTVLGLSATESAALSERLRTISAHDFAVGNDMRTLFRRFFADSENLPPGPFKTLKLRTTVLQILLTAIQCADNQPSVKALRKITSIAKLIAKRPSHRFSIAELARHAKLSESHFTALFRQTIGLPPNAYLSKCRLEAVKTRLRTTDDTVREIAHDLGYASAQHLATQFRKTFGITASDWRAASRR